MTKNSFIIILLTGSLFACDQPVKKGTATDTAQQVTDTAQVKQPLLDDTMAKSPASTDTGTNRTITADWLISPGKGIGHILINEDAAKVTQQLGKPDSSDAAMGSALMVWYARHNARGYRTSVFSHHNMGGKDEVISRVQKILVTSPQFKTAEGIGAGTTIDQIKKSYTLKPTSDYKNKDGKVQVYTDMDKGISFEINANNKCVGVVVHKPHDTGSAYLNMH